MGLPLHVHKVRFYGTPVATEGSLFAVVTPDPDQGSFHADVVDAKGKRYLHLSGYHTVGLPNAVDAQGLKALQAAMSLEAVAA
jgi:hypothetical protein